MKYLTPEYYTKFQCKCGQCRRSCCSEWPISISKIDYYRLLGISCSKKLRAKLDCALKLYPDPSQERFAQISLDWQGSCMLHRKDGYCALQSELGEEALAEVCRVYPSRMTQLSELNQCSCSNSCEKVIELLMDQKTPMIFEEQDLPYAPEIKLPFDRYDSCKQAISILQDRNMLLPKRFSKLNAFLSETYSIDYLFANPSPASGTCEHLWLAFPILHQLNTYFENSPSIQDYCARIQDYYHTTGKEKLTEADLLLISEQHAAAAKHLEVILPEWQILLEQLLVNHLFYNNFPYSDMQNKEESFLSLALIYAFLRYNLLGYMAGQTDIDKLVDVLAAMFRLIEHSDFRHRAVFLLHKAKLSIRDSVSQLLLV